MFPTFIKAFKRNTHIYIINNLYNLPLVILFYRHGLANSVVHLSVSCDGTETHILNCDQFRVVNTSCSHLNDIEIICCELL